MKTLLLGLCATGLLVTGAASASAPSGQTESAYQPMQAFAPFDYRYPVNRYRSANGQPGPDYWQNRVDYDIDATLDPASKTLSATETFTYTNHSPDTLRYLWLQMDQNTYRSDARSNFANDRPGDPNAHTDGYRIASVEVRQGGKWVKAATTVSDTRMRIDLPAALAPEGGKAEVRIVYSYTVPGSFGGRTDWFKSKNGDIFEIAQWFPRLAVYDDLHGWDTQPYLGSEFYLEYGDIDYAVTVPADMIVVGSGTLTNPKEVLTDTQYRRLEKARNSDDTVLIRKPDEVTDPSSRPKKSGTLTWRFHMDNTRDVAFGASRAYVLDAARINLPGGKHALAMSAYPVESIVKDGWQHSTQHVKYTIEYFSRWFPYPWSTAVAEAGTAGGMEYPGIVFDSYKAKGDFLFWLTVHEMGHNWYPMIVGSNERRDAWMDEGFNTFVDAMAQQHWGDTHNGEFAPKQDGEYAPETGDPAKDIVKVLADPDAPTILTRADVAPAKYRHPVTYFKAAYGMTLLREQILGPELFDKAFREYTHAWAFKHPSPSDFFRAMESAAGEDLAWFWRGWYANNWKLDLAVTGVTYIDNDPAKGSLVTVANLDKLPMPSTLEVTLADGSTQRVRVPVNTWMRNKHFSVTVDTHQRVVKAVIDPDGKLPDADRSNNSWSAH